MPEANEMSNVKAKKNHHTIFNFFWITQKQFCLFQDEVMMWEKILDAISCSRLMFPLIWAFWKFLEIDLLLFPNIDLRWHMSILIWDDRDCFAPPLSEMMLRLQSCFLHKSPSSLTYQIRGGTISWHCIACIGKPSFKNIARIANAVTITLYSKVTM